MRFARFLGPLVALPAMACSGGGDTTDIEGSEPAGDEAERITIAPEVVHEFERDGETYRVLASGDDLIMTGEGNVGSLPTRVRAPDGIDQLTLLETAMTLAPELEPDERLIELHSLEAGSLGRLDEDVRTGHVESSVLVDKAFSDCEIIALNTLQMPSSGNWGYDYLTVFVRDFTHGTYSKTAPVVAVVCNTGTEELDRNLCYRYDANVTWTCWGWSTTPKGGHRWVRMPLTSSNKSVEIQADYDGVGTVPIVAAWGVQY